jgi:hypothetical protein
VPATRQKERPLLSDDELLAVITRDLKAVYSDIIRQPLPKELAGCPPAPRDASGSLSG